MNSKKAIAWRLMPIQVATILVFAFACLYLIPHFIKKSAEDEAVVSAQLMAKQFVLMRSYYTENVVSKILASDTTITPHFNHKSMPEGIPLPASFILDMSDLMQDSSIKLKFYSPYPFANRGDRTLDTFGKDAWSHLSIDAEVPFVFSDNSNNAHIIRVAVADTMVNQVCVDCHNSHHLSPKTDWKLGDLRGVLEISKDISVEVENGLWTGRFLALALVLVFGGITFFSFRLQRDEFKRSKKVLADNLEELDFQKFALDEHAIVSITNTQGDITYANEKFCNISGYSRDELIGKNHRILKSDEHPPEFFEDMWKTISRGSVWHGEVKNKTKNDQNYWVMSTIVPTLNAKGKPFQYISIRTDITKRKEAEMEALTASRAKSDLMANMSHELRTPLNAIIGFSDTIMSEAFGPIGNDKYQEYMNDINYSGKHLLELINDILDVSAIEAGAIELHEEAINVSSVVDAAIRLIAPRADQGRVSVYSSIDTETLQIYMDERRAKQIFLNLLSNAVKFTPEGGEVSVSSWVNDDGSLSISVADTGIGMDESEIRKALSVFGQVDSGLDRKHEGTGLGLPLAKRLVEQHEGTLEIKSKKSHGTHVIVTFPSKRIIGNVRLGS